jgi:transcriptional regulator with XRE-family HTH domain
MNGRVRLKAENDRLLEELAQQREETRIKDARMARINPHRCPYYPPTERMAILELRAARGWTLEQTASTFIVTGATIAAWMKRLDEAGPDALVQLREPVNKFPDFVRYAVQRLKTLCPSLGKVKLAQVLWRCRPPWNKDSLPKGPGRARTPSLFPHASTHHGQSGN